MSTTLRPHGSSHSPTSSIGSSSQTTTPTSPHFMHAQAAMNPRYASHPYASSSTSLESRLNAGSIISQRPITPPLLRPPPQTTFSNYLRNWGQDELAAFLALHRCEHYMGDFVRNDIDGRVICDLDMSSLKEIGVQKVGERVRLLGAIKDLRKRVAGSTPSAVMSRVELRLNGVATPPLVDGPLPPPVDHGRSRLFAPQERSGAGNRRLQNTRPPPLDLQPHHGSRPLPQAYQNSLNSATSSRQHIAPRPVTRPSLPTQNSSSSTVTQAALSSSVPAPSRSNLNLRAPPPRDPTRRSPSPVNPDVANFADRPLPPAPDQHQSSAAEYASTYTQQRHATEGRSTPTWAQSEHQYGLPKGPAPVSTGRQPAQMAIRNEHRKTPSVGTGTPVKTSPIKSKFSAMIGRPPTSTTAGPIHPFAANRAREEEAGKKSSTPSLGPATGDSVLSNQSWKNPTGGYVVGSGGMITAKSSSSEPRRKDPERSGSTQSQLPLEDIRRQVVKFINKEDGTSRTVSVASCTSGVEVLERVLKKFGKWNTAQSVSTDGESEDEGDRLEVDGWGIYAESDPDDETKPLSEASLLGICLSHRDGSVVREKGLVLRRNRKWSQQNRKNMEVFFGETPPPPMSPTSPSYRGGPRLGYQAPALGDEDPSLLTPSKAGRSKKMNRASTVSVMSGLGVPMPGAEIPPSPSTTLRSPSSNSFLGGKGRKTLYNFFGHRPPSELITSHLGEYFPSAKRKELEKSRNSMLRLSTGPNTRRISAVPSENRPSFESRRSSIASPPRRKSIRPVSRASPPPAATIPEEGEMETEAIPRVSVSNDGGMSVRPKIDGESDLDSTASVESRPPLLPPFEPSQETLSDSLGQYSPQLDQGPTEPPPPMPRARPKSIIQPRRGSAGSTKSRMSMLSQLRRNRDRTDTASLLTVDEITAEVEQRRASTITFDESSDEEEDLVEDIPPVVDPGLVPRSEDEEDEADEEDSTEESSEEDSSEEEEEEEEEDDENAEQGKAFTSTGSRIFKWIKGALIGAGSFGSVFLGMDAQSGLLMAVKQVQLPTGSARNEEKKRTMVDALEREIELLKELQHDNIVQYLDSSSDGSHLNIFLEYVPGGSVAALLNNYGAFEEALVKNFCRQILTGLNYLHEREIIHRDIKGANILVDNKGGIKISDFGISKKVESNLMTGMRVNRPSLQGSVFWMAPEVVKQTSYTSKADIWSVGCLVVEMLTGTHPWAELSQMQAIFKIGSMARPATPSEISADAADFLRKTFEIDHTARPTAAELLEHSFIAQKGAAMISAQQARNAMAQASKAREGMMGSMQSLSALAAER